MISRRRCFPEMRSRDWLVFVLTKVVFLWPFVWWGVEWERTLIVCVRFGSGSMALRVRFGSGSCLACNVKDRILFGSFGSGSVLVPSLIYISQVCAYSQPFLGQRSPHFGGNIEDHS